MAMAVSIRIPTPYTIPYGLEVLEVDASEIAKRATRTPKVADPRVIK
jgi:hypothetical protein